MRVVIDSNVIVAAYAARGLCEALYQALLRDHELLTSDHIIAEVTRNLARKLKVPAEEVRNTERAIRDRMVVVVPAELPKGLAVSAEDGPVVGTAICACPCHLVTGDAELIEIGAVAEMQIVSPRGLYELMRRPAK